MTFVQLCFLLLLLFRFQIFSNVGVESTITLLRERSRMFCIPFHLWSALSQTDEIEYCSFGAKDNALEIEQQVRGGRDFFWAEAV